jgi:exosome complex component MTR3
MQTADRTRFHSEQTTIAPKIKRASAKDNKRRDDRAANQFRPIFTRTGVVSHAAGSAYLEVNNTKLICSIYGPRPAIGLDYADRGMLHCEVKYASWASAQRSQARQYEKEERALASTLEKCFHMAIDLDRYPKSLIDINLLVLEDDGAVLAHAINATSLALVDASIHLFDLVTASAVGCMDAAHNKLLLDPDHEEESQLTGSLTLAYMTAVQRVAQVEQSGELQIEVVIQGTKLCIDGAIQAHALFSKHLKEQIKNKRPTS